MVIASMHSNKSQDIFCYAYCQKYLHLQLSTIETLVTSQFFIQNKILVQQESITIYGWYFIEPFLLLAQ